VSTSTTLAETVAADAGLTIARDLIVRRCLTKPEFLQLAWGSGSSREEFETDSPRLAIWLLSLTSPHTATELAAAAKDELGLCSDDALKLVHTFVEHRLLAPKNGSLPEAERTWTRLEWWDALTFHRAIRGMRWRHEYPEGADVYTWFDRDKLVSPNTPPPEVIDEPSESEIELPEPTADVYRANLRKTLDVRRTSRHFAGARIDLEKLSDLLHWTFRPIVPGPSHRRYFTTRLATDSYRKVPPEGVTAYTVFDPGKLPAPLGNSQWIYRYSPQRHSLVPVSCEGKAFRAFSDLLWAQTFADGAPVIIVLAVNWGFYMWKYRYSTFYRMAHFDLGSLMQTLLLVATALDVRTFITPAIDDLRFANLLNTHPNERDAAYIVALGHR
jgi:SagB-type dehydrogenase family enzyme